MWTKFHLKNFKGYEDSGLQELRRLTVLIGPNGGGKSTILQFLMLLKQTAESSDTVTTIISSVDRDKLGKGFGYVDLGQYKDYVFTGDTEKSVEFYLEWDPTYNPGREKRSKIDEALATEVRAIEVALIAPRPRYQVFVNTLKYWADSKPPPEEALQETPNDVLVSLERSQRAAYVVEMADDWRGDKLRNQSRDYEPQKFYRLARSLLAELPTETEEKFRTYVLEFEDRIVGTYYIGPLREYPRRYYESTGERPPDLGLKGEKIGIVLHAEYETLRDKTNTWLRKLGLAEAVSLSRISKGNLFHINIQGPGQQRPVNLADYGFGASQILPVIVECLYSPEGATILIEQPEIHLNAHHQLELPNFFAELLQTTRKQFIVETHSEYFLKRLGTLVLQGVLKPEEVNVLYCYADESGSHIHPITLDEFGQYSWWPSDFLSEAYEGTVEYLEAAESRMEADGETEEDADHA